MNEPISISWQELNTRKVDQRLREQHAVRRNRAYAQLNADALPVATSARANLLNSTIFCMTVLGIIGGLLAWTAGWATHFSSAEQDALDLTHGMRRIEVQQAQGAIRPDVAQATLALLRARGQSNPYFAMLVDGGLTSAWRAAQVAQVERRARAKRFTLDLLGFGLSGLLLAACLGVAEPLTERSAPKAIRNGALGAALGLGGGMIVALFVDQLYRAAAGAPEDVHHAVRQVLARALAWGALGLFLTAGPGLLMRNRKKFLIGVAGGLAGGAIGGALFDPVERIAGEGAGRMVALIAIGALAGLGTGLIENAAKTGWLRVTAGLIAGKQFILYRNPTYIGSAPECQIYLFRDPKVGRRHAALHLLRGGGVEIEDLPLGARTIVNGAPINRLRLRNGDKITVGATAFVFQEKEAAGGGAPAIHGSTKLGRAP